jgi:hypothetical protein
MDEMDEMDEMVVGGCVITHLRHAVPDPLEMFFISVAAIRNTGGAMMACVPAPHGHHVALMSAPYPIFRVWRAVSSNANTS